MVAFRYINHIIHLLNRSYRNSAIGMLDYMHDFVFTRSEIFEN